MFICTIKLLVGNQWLDSYIYSIKRLQNVRSIVVNFSFISLIGNVCHFHYKYLFSNRPPRCCGYAKVTSAHNEHKNLFH